MDHAARIILTLNLPPAAEAAERPERCYTAPVPAGWGLPRGLGAVIEDMSALE